MRKTIWKFTFEVRDSFELDLPSRSTPLSVQVQGGVPCLWMLVEPDTPRVKRRFYVRGTGHPCDDCDADRFIGTFQLAGGQLVFHLFGGPVVSEVQS